MRMVVGGRRSAVSPVVATLLLIAIAVGSAIVAFAFITGLIGGLSSGSTTEPIAVTGTLSIPTGSGSGTLVFQIRNSGNSAITNVQFTLAPQMATYTGPNGQATANNGDPVGDVISIAGQAVSATNPLGVGDSASGSIQVSSPGGASGINVGTDYSLTMTVTFHDGGTQYQSVSVIGQI